jgi:tRNA/tmRNA/rRNA uracil-C5-methylase (TrmA/RlmC/RlmD family)
MGIRIDENSWEQVLPEAVADYLSERCQCDTILDAFSGVGSTSIKFSMRCRSVLAANSNLLRLECLDNNTRLYAADNIIKLHE